MTALDIHRKIGFHRYSNYLHIMFTTCDPYKTTLRSNLHQNEYILIRIALFIKERKTPKNCSNVLPNKVRLNGCEMDVTPRTTVFLRQLFGY